MLLVIHSEPELTKATLDLCPSSRGERGKASASLSGLSAPLKTGDYSKHGREESTAVSERTFMLLVTHGFLLMPCGGYFLCEEQSNSPLLKAV